MAVVGGYNVWVGANDQEDEGKWRWTDESPLRYTKWMFGYGKTGDSNNCALMYKGAMWIDWTCTNRRYFLCQMLDYNFASPSQTFTYTQDQLTFSYFEVQYLYYVSSQELMDSWEHKRMTGFRLSWFLQDNNGSRLSDMMPDLSQSWIPTKEPVDPKYSEPNLVNLVELAARARTMGMTQEDVIKITLQEKEDFVQSLSMSSICSDGQEMSWYYLALFNQLNLGVDKTFRVSVIPEDKRTGLMMFSAIVYCSESVALFQFLHNLLATQSPRTIIQATVNTIQSDDIKDPINRKRLNEFSSRLTTFSTSSWARSSWRQPPAPS
jgi:hypothetical protein